MNDIKFIVLCNNRIAVPAIQELCFYGRLSAVIIPSDNKEVLADVQAVLKNSSVQVTTVSKETFHPETLRIISETKPDAGLVMTFPHKLLPGLYGATPKGFFNFHYGALPQYRGPEPIFAQIKNKESLAGLTVHIIDETIDGGPVVLEEKIAINSEDSYGIVQTKLAYLGAKLADILAKTVQFSSVVPSRKQDETKALYHRRPMLNDVLINWKEMDSATIKALVNACNPWNKGAGARIKNYIIGLLEIEITSEEIKENITPGTIVSLNSGGLMIATKDRKIINAKIIYCPEGFISGHRLGYFGIKEGDCFE